MRLRMLSLSLLLGLLLGLLRSHHFPLLRLSALCPYLSRLLFLPLLWGLLPSLLWRPEHLTGLRQCVLRLQLTRLLPRLTLLRLHLGWALLRLRYLLMFTSLSLMLWLLRSHNLS